MATVRHPTETSVPVELREALARAPACERAFAAFSPSHRREYSQWVAGAKRPQTRVARAEKAVAMIAAKERPA